MPRTPTLPTGAARDDGAGADAGRGAANARGASATGRRCGARRKRPRPSAAARDTADRRRFRARAARQLRGRILLLPQNYE